MGFAPNDPAGLKDAEQARQVYPDIAPPPTYARPVVLALIAVAFLAGFAVRGHLGKLGHGAGPSWTGKRVVQIYEVGPLAHSTGTSAGSTSLVAIQDGLNARLKGLEVDGYEVAATQDGKIQITLPDDPHTLQIIQDLVGVTDVLQFNEVLSQRDSSPPVTTSDPKEMVVRSVETRSADGGHPGLIYQYVVRREPEITGASLVDSEVVMGQFGDPEINFAFDDAGAELMTKVSTRLLHKQLAIIIGGRVYMAPEIQSVISRRGRITGKFELETAKQLSRIMRTPPLPAPLKLVSTVPAADR